MKTGIEILTQTLEQEKINRYELGKRYGLTKQAVYSLWRQGDVTVKRFSEMMALLGYEVSINKRNYRMISKEEMEEIEESHEPRGLFFTESAGLYVVLDSRGEILIKREFKTQDKCMEYLNAVE